MTDIVLHDIDPLLAERIKRLGEVRGWDVAGTLLHVLRLGLRTLEGGAAVQLADAEEGALQEAIAALEHVPNDPGFALIGRAEPPTPEAEQPDQSIAGGFALK